MASDNFIRFGEEHYGIEEKAIPCNWKPTRWQAECWWSLDWCCCAMGLVEVFVRVPKLTPTTPSKSLSYQVSFCPVLALFAVIPACGISICTLGELFMAMDPKQRVHAPSFAPFTPLASACTFRTPVEGMCSQAWLYCDKTLPESIVSIRTSTAISVLRFLLRHAPISTGSFDVLQSEPRDCISKVQLSILAAF